MIPRYGMEFLKINSNVKTVFFLNTLILKAIPGLFASREKSSSLFYEFRGFSADDVCMSALQKA